MEAKTMLRATVAATALAFAPMAASAVSISSQQMSAAELGAVTPTPNPLFDGVIGTANQNVTGSQREVRLSPFAGSANAGTGVYSSVQAGSTGRYDYIINQRSLNMIWGSPDTYNILTLRLGGELVKTITPGTTPGAPPAPQQGAWQFSVKNVLFDEVSFQSTTNNAFEFANYTTAPVPLPAAGLLLLTALGGMKVMSRRRKKAEA